MKWKLSDQRLTCTRKRLDGLGSSWSRRLKSEWKCQPSAEILFSLLPYLRDVFSVWRIEEWEKKYFGQTVIYENGFRLAGLSHVTYVRAKWLNGNCRLLETHLARKVICNWPAESQTSRGPPQKNDDRRESHSVFRIPFKWPKAIEEYVGVS